MTDIDLEALSARFHDIYQKEIRRQGQRQYYPDEYGNLSEDVKELDRVLARWVLAHFTANFTELPPA